MYLEDRLAGLTIVGAVLDGNAERCGVDREWK